MKHTIFTLLLLSLLATTLRSQSGLIPKSNATFSDVKGQLDLLPRLTTNTVEDSLLVYGNAQFNASYRFHNSHLTFAFIEHDFESKQLSESEVVSYILQLQKEGATVIPVMKSKKVSVHSIFLDGMRFDLVYRELGRKNHKVSLKMQTELVEKLMWASANRFENQ